MSNLKFQNSKQQQQLSDENDVFHELEPKQNEVYWKVFFSDQKLFILEKIQANLIIIDARTKGVAKLGLKNNGSGQSLNEQVMGRP